MAATLKRNGLIRSQLITIVTDVIPHAVWQNKGTDVYWVMAEESRDVLIKRDASLKQIYVKGIPISPKFNQEQDRVFLRKKFGLSEDRSALLFTSGSFGIGPTEKMLERLGKWGNRAEAMVVCGKNKNLFRVLNQKRYPFPLILFGLVDNMHELMSVAHLLIAKPGGATMSESLAKRVPMLIVSTIPGQEADNAKWLLDRRAALKLNNLNGFSNVMADFLNDSGTFDVLQKSIDVIAKPNAGNDLVDFVYARAGKLK